MKKTTTVNIGGFVFHIDEDAYEKLLAYLKQIEQHFSNDEERKEIMEDIEIRIAELFKEGNTGHKEVISIEDVENMKEVMGNPADFAEEAEPTTEEKKKEQQQSSTSGSKRLYRDPDGAILGGVCSGLGAYWAIDPNIVRAIFIIAFLGAGIGLVVYIVLWMVTPEAKTTAQKLEMKGEPVNFSNIGKSVKDEFHKVKKNMKL